MSELDLINKTPMPITTSTIKGDLEKLGVKKGMTLMVHGSLSSMGWVCGGAQAVIDSLIQTLSEEGNLVFPTQSGGNSEPMYWCMPPVPEDWWQIIRDEMPTYDPLTTPTRGMGAMAELFRTYPKVKRSSHPHVSFAAYGKDQDFIIDNHTLEFGLNERSPLGRLYELDGWVLLLGVDYSNNTSFHLAEYDRPNANIAEMGGPILENGKRVWKKYPDIDYLPGDEFIKIGEEFEKTCPVIVGQIGLATCKLFKVRDTVDFARKYMVENCL